MSNKLQAETRQSYQNFQAFASVAKTNIWKYWYEFEYKYLRTGKSKLTVRNAKDALKFISRNCGINTIEDCNNHRLLEDALFKIKKERGFSNVTYNSYLKNMNTYFIWLEKQDYIETNNLRKVAKCTEEQNEQLTLSKEQVKLIIAQVNDRRQTKLQMLRNVFFINLLRHTGARPCEILNIKCGDIKKGQNGTILSLKGRKQKGRIRYYRFRSWLKVSYENYKAYKDKIRKDEPYLLISSSKQGKWTQNGMRGLLKRLSNELDFRITAYSFRRFVATHLNEIGKDIKHIQNYLGHQKPSTTSGYIERSCFLTNECGDAMSEIK